MSTNQPRPPFIVRRAAAIGDCIAASVVCQKLSERGYAVNYQTHNLIHGIAKRLKGVSTVSEPSANPNINLDGAYENHPDRKRLHFTSAFIGATNQQLQRTGIHLPETNCVPELRVTKEERQQASIQLNGYPRPWVFICPRSDSYAARQVPDYIWQEAAAKMQGTKFWIGRNPAPKNCVDLKCKDIVDVMLYLSVADLLVSVDTGPLHIAAALGIPSVAIGQSSSPELHLPDQRDFITISGKLDCLNCQKNLCPIDPHIPPCQKIDPDFVASWVNAKLRQKFSERVSCVIPVYKPDAHVLEECLIHIETQVDEIIIALQGDSELPKVKLSTKCRVVKKPINALGYSRNCNHGARYTTGKYILFLNEDVYMNPGAVKAMLDVMKPGVGAVAGKLWYPDGTLYHAGKFRKAGEKAWGHVDLRAREATIKQPVEVENVNGAAIMVRREAFYDVKGMDEAIRAYGSDDDLCLSLRQRDWRIWYTPHSEGTHLEGQAYQKLTGGDRRHAIIEGNTEFERKWSWWWAKNLHNVPNFQ